MCSGCHGNNYQSCLINFLNCLMIKDPLNSPRFFLSLIQVVVFLLPHFHSTALTPDRQDNRNYREIKFGPTSLPACSRGWKQQGWFQYRGLMPNVDACIRRVSELLQTLSPADLVWRLTEVWEQPFCHPWSARRNSSDTSRQVDSYLVTPTLPSPITRRALNRLSLRPAVRLWLTHSLSFSFSKSFPWKFRFDQNQLDLLFQLLFMELYQKQTGKFIDLKMLQVNN